MVQTVQMGIRDAITCMGTTWRSSNEIELTFWGGEGLRLEQCIGALKCDVNYGHRATHRGFRLPQTPPVFLFGTYCSVSAQ